MRNKRALVAVLAVILAVLGIASLVVWTNNARERAFSGTETVTVWQVTKDVPAGTEADAIGDSVEQVKLPRASVPSTALTSLETVQGEVTTASLVPGEVLVSGRFGSTKEAQEVSVPKGLQEVTLELASTRVLGGNLKRGERVGVLTSYQPPASASYQTNFAANRALVLSVTSMTATPQASGQGSEQAPVGGNLQVRLALPSVSVGNVVNAMEFGKVWLARQNTDAEVARELIDAQGVLQ